MNTVGDSLVHDSTLSPESHTNQIPRTSTDFQHKYLVIKDAPIEEVVSTSLFIKDENVHRMISTAQSIINYIKESKGLPISKDQLKEFISHGRETIKERQQNELLIRKDIVILFTRLL